MQKSIYITMLCILAGFSVPAQKVTFDYDKNGSRILREVDLPRKEIQTSVYELDDIITEDRSVKIYPNPVKDFLQISIFDKSTENIEVFDAFGRKRLVIDNISVNNSINFTEFESGVYFLKILGKTYKVVKQ